MGQGVADETADCVPCFSYTMLCQRRR